jgi:BirA family transcriptional regulator, biotin operon repressor / biotin---[acetyl-CoA-carboxylase] ligase
MPSEPDFRWDVERIIAQTCVAAVEIHASLPSTNDRALQLAAETGTPLPHLVLADQQTRGRGRGQNTWWAASGSLTFSVLLQLDANRLPVARWPEVSLTVGSSICAAVNSLLPGEDVGLKWPNDVYLRGAKLSGILVEIPPHSERRMVIGVGLNVANSAAGAPADLRQRTIALCDVGGPTSRQDVLISVLREFEQQLSLLADDPEAVRSQWRRFDLLIGRSVTIAEGAGEFSGTANGIDDDGALLVRTEGGTRRCYGGVVQAFG